MHRAWRAVLMVGGSGSPDISENIWAVSENLYFVQDWMMVDRGRDRADQSGSMEGKFLGLSYGIFKCESMKQLHTYDCKFNSTTRSAVHLNTPTTHIHTPSQWCLCVCIRDIPTIVAASKGARTAHSLHAWPRPGGLKHCNLPLR